MEEELIHTSIRPKNRSSEKETLTRRACFSFGALLFALLVSACNPIYGNSTAENGYSPGVALSLSNSSLSIPVSQVTAGNSAVVTLTLRDTNDVFYSSSGASVVISSSGGTSTGTLSATVQNPDGTYSATFTAVQAGTPLTFSATVNGSPITSSLPSLQVIPGNASGISVVSGNSQSAQDGTVLAPFVVFVKDANGNALSNAQIDWVVTAGGGSLSQATSTTNSNGKAQSTLTLGANAGINSVTATVDGTSDSVLFTAVATVGAVSASESTVSSSPAVVPADGTTTSVLTVTLYDANGNPVSGKAVSLSSSRGATDTISSPSGPSNSYGQVSFTVTSRTAGSATFSAVDTTDSINVTTTASVSFLSGTPTISIAAGNNQSAQAGAQAAVAPEVHVQDSYGNALVNTEVDWSITAGGGSTAYASVETDGTGNASNPWTLGTTAGANTLVATINGTSYSVTFNATATAGAASAISISTGNSQTGVAGSTLSNAFVASVKDSNGNAVSGATVDWSVSAGGGSLSSSSGATNSSGLSSSTLTLGTIAGANTVTATIDGTSTSVTFTATGIAGNVNSSTGNLTASPSTVTANGSSTSLITVTLRDANGNTVSGKTVTLSSNRGSADTISAASGVSNSSGQVTFTVSSATEGTSTYAAVDTTDGITLTTTTSVIFSAGSPASIIVSSGNNQTATAGSALINAFVALVKDANGNVINNVTVDWAVASGGGSLSNASSTTNSSGLAGTVLTLGGTAGTNTVTATANGTSYTTTFTATGVAGTASSISVSTGNSQSGVSGSALTNAFVALVKDSNGNPVNNATVNWSVSSGGGSLSSSSNATNSGGLSSSTLTLGALVGTNTVTATINGTSDSVTFTATGTAGAAASIAVSSGNNQSSSAGSVLGSPFTAVVRDSNGNVVPNVTVNWAVVAGGGSLSAATSTTSSSGLASSTLTLGPTNGTNTVSATVSGTSYAVTFSAVGASGGVSSSNSTVTSSPASVTANGSATSTITVTLKDSNSNPVTGKTVTLSSSRGSSDTISAASGASNGSGMVTFTVTSTIAGSSTYTATDSTDTITLNSTANVAFTAGAAASIAVSSGSAQSATVGSALSSPFSAIVKDANGNVVNNATVTWAVTGGGGSLSASTSSTNSSGIASSTLTLGTTAGTNTVTASVSGVGTPATFAATGTAGSASTITVSAGNNQSGTAGSPLGGSLVALVQDSNGNAVSSVTVDWAVASGGGSLSSTSNSTNGSGLSTTALTLGTAVGTNTATATIHGTSTSVTFTETGVAGAAASITISAGNDQSGTAGAALSTALSVIVKDSNGNAVNASMINWAVTAGGGTLTSATSSTNTSGLATDGLTLGATAGTNTVTATVNGTSYVATFTETGSAGAASAITVSSGNTQSAVVGSTLSTAFTALVKDSNGNVVNGATINWAVTAGGGSLSSSSDSTNSGGLASSTLTLGTVSGSNTVTATINGTSTSVTFNATGTAGAVSTTFSTVSSAPASVTANGSTSTVTVTLKDSYGNAVSGKTVALSSSRGSSDTISAASGASSLSGVVTFTVSSLVSGTSTYTAVDSTDTLTIAQTTSVSFVAGAAASIAVSSGNNQTGTAGSPLAGNLIVIVKDANANVVPNVSVSWTVASGGGSLGSSSVVTDSGGLSSDSLTLGSSAGTNTVTASVAGVSGTVTFTEIASAGAPGSIAVQANNNQSASVGASLTSALQAIVKDANSNPVGSGIAVTWAVASGGGSVSGCASSTTNSSGIASCTPTLGTAAGANTFTASVSGVGTSASFSATGTALTTISSLAWGTAPSTTYTASSSTPMTVFTATLKDTYGNTITSNSSTTVTASITSGSGALGGTDTVTVANGVATFNAVTDTTASTITIQAKENTSNNVVTQTNVVVSASSTIASLAWGTAPSTSYTASGSTPMTTFTALLKDSNGNTITSNSTTTVTASVTSGSGTLGGTATVTAANGVATFSAVTDTTASTITIQAKENTSSNVVTQTNVVVGPGAFSLAQSQVSSPSTVVAGSSITVTLTAKDAYGNANPTGITGVAFTSSTVGGTGSYGSVNNAGGGIYTALFTASASGSCTLGATINSSTVTDASSPASITITSASATQLVFTTEPASSGTTSTGFAPAVTIEDSYGNKVGSASNAIAIAAYTGSSCTGAAPGVLGGTLSVNASSGVASFSGITYTKSQTIYIQATSSGLASACSSAIAVGAGPVYQYILSGPTSLTAGTCSAAYTVQAQDQYGNNSTFSSATTVNLSGGGAGTFYSDACVTSATSVSISSGSGTQTFYFEDGTAQSETLTAASTGVTTNGTLAVTIGAGSASKLAFTTEPSSTGTAGTALTTQPSVSIEDAFGNVVNSTLSVTLSAYTNSTCTTAASTALGVTTNPVSASAGVATFSGVNTTAAGSLYIQASSSGLTSACSSLVTVSGGAAYELSFATEPSSMGTTGTALATQPVVNVLDQYGNISPVATAILLKAYSDAACGTVGKGTLSATNNPKTSTAGTSTFAGVKYTLSGTFYLDASVSGLEDVCSSAITLTPPAPTELTITGGPSVLDGVCSSAMTINSADANANPSNVTTNKTINLSSTGSGVFYSNSTCTTSISSIALNSGTNSVTVYFKDSVAESPTLSAADNAALLSTGTLALNVKQPTQISAGDNHTCAVISGGLQCWGYDNQGQLGNNTSNVSSAIPVQVSGLTSGVTQVSGGDTFSCAVVSGAAKCWGYGLPLGDNSTATAFTPQQVYGLTSGVTAVASGGSAACAIVSGGVQCWGSNTYGQLGNNNLSVTSSDVPVQVYGLTSGVTAIAAGANHFCAIVSGGAQCWGYNLYGQLGNSSTTNSVVPVQVSGLTSNVTEIGTGNDHSCAVVGGATECWGANTVGQLGNNSLSNSSTPVAVSGLSSGVTAIFGGTLGNETCAIVNGAAECWGSNSNGQLGDNSGASSSKVPVQVTGLTSGVTSIGVGQYHACAIVNGNIQCWGDEAYGQLGNGVVSNVLSPEQVSGLSSGVTAVSNGGAGNSSSNCAIVNGAAECWGNNGNGQLGNNTTTNSAVPVAVQGLTSGVTKITTGSNFGCAIVSGEAECWGAGTDGELGNGGTSQSLVPVAVTGLSSGVTSIGAGQNHACAVVSGEAECWGNNNNGQLGNNSTTNSSTAVAVQGLSGTVTSVTTGANHSCALISDGTVYCWGLNSGGQLGNNSTTSSSTAVQVQGLGSGSGVVAISGAGAYTCAVFSNGTSQCWGANGYGNLGNGTTNNYEVPVQVQNMQSGATIVAAGYENTCWVVSGTLRCAGLNSNGELGNGTTTNISNASQALASGVTSAGGSLATTCAVMSGAAYCWGSDFYGQVGINSNYESLVPVVSGPFFQ